MSKPKKTSLNRRIKIKVPPQTIIVKIPQEHVKKIQEAHFKKALMKCRAMPLLNKSNRLLLGIASIDFDFEPELKIDLDKIMRDLVGGGWGFEYDEIVSMIESFSRTNDFLQQSLKTMRREACGYLPK